VFIASIIRAIDFIALMMEAVRTFDTSVYSNETTRRFIQEGPNFHSSVVLQTHSLYITWGISNWPVGGSSSETQSHPISINNNNYEVPKQLSYRFIEATAVSWYIKCNNLCINFTCVNRHTSLDIVPMVIT
jgi:hypothetical protein